MEKYETKDTDLQAGGFEEGVEAQDNAKSVEPDDMVCTQCVKGADDLRNAPPICYPRAIILPRSTKKHTHTVSTKPFEAATCSDGLCVQLYNSITCSKKEKNTKNSYAQLTLLQQKKSSSRQPLNFHQQNQALFRRVLYHNIELLSISTLIFYIRTHTQHHQKIYKYDNV